MIAGNFWLSLLVLIVSCIVLLYAVLAFAHVRITDGDMGELQRLRNDGELPAEPNIIADFQLVRAKLNDIAPAVCLRQELWLQLYFYLLRGAHWWQRRTARGSVIRGGALERELLRLSAYQAGHYRVALTRMDAIRNPIL
ncbi:MAG TPA: hypothetical protein VN515_00910 [Terriglobales bacterium]|nr:hypothetical protein [Terriglobales bacterium]